MKISIVEKYIENSLGLFLNKISSAVDIWTQNDSKNNEKSQLSKSRVKTMKIFRDGIHFFTCALNCPIANPAPRCWGK